MWSNSIFPQLLTKDKVSAMLNNTPAITKCVKRHKSAEPDFVR